jgi:all-trans-retinol dehydrogenase (NAD+)
MRLAGKRVLITGAGHGLGRALAHRFAAAGAAVVVTDRDADRASAVAAELGAAAYPLDVTSAEQVAAVRDRVLAEFGPIDVLVNNAGVVFGGEFHQVALDRHRATIDVNLTGVLAVTHAFLADLIARPAAHVVNVASAAAVVPLPFAAGYAATKAAVLAFSDSLREELRRTGRRHVGVTAVCPSFIDTGMFAGARPARLTWLLSADAVAAAAVRAVERGRGFVLLPWTARLLYALGGALPRSAYHRLCGWLRVSESMRSWRGRPG